MVYSSFMVYSSSSAKDSSSTNDLTTKTKAKRNPKNNTIFRMLLVLQGLSVNLIKSIEAFLST